MGDLADHAANFRRIHEFFRAANLVQAETDQRFTLARLAADRAADLTDGDGFLSHVTEILLS